MVDKAFDAFSQRRNTGTRDKLAERTKVETYNDPNRYQMPPRRRLGVVATNRDTTVTPEKTSVTRLAESLSAVKPTLMDIIVNNNVKQNKEQIQLGIKDAAARAAFENQDPEYVDNEWRKYGYEQHKAFMQGEDLGIQLQEAVQFKPVEQSWDEFYENWWAEQNKLNPNLATMNPEHVDQFNGALQPGITKAKTVSMAEQIKEKEKNIKKTAVDYVTKDLYLQLSEGRELDNRYLTGLRDHLMGFHHDSTEASDFIFEAISNVINDDDLALDDTRNLVKLLKTDRGENGEIPSYYNTKNKETVTLLDTIVKRKNDEITKENQRVTKITSALTTQQTNSKAYLKSKTNIVLTQVAKALGEDERNNLIFAWGEVKNGLDSYAKRLYPRVIAGEITQEEYKEMYEKRGEILIDKWGIRSEASTKNQTLEAQRALDQETDFANWLAPAYATPGKTQDKGRRAFQVIQAVEKGEDPNAFFADTDLTWETLTEEQKDQLTNMADGYKHSILLNKENQRKQDQIRANELLADSVKTQEEVKAAADKEMAENEPVSKKAQEEADLKNDKMNEEQRIRNNEYPIDPNTGVAVRNNFQSNYTEQYRQEQEELKRAHIARAKQYDWDQTYMNELNEWHESSPDFMADDWENDPELQEELQEFHSSNTVADDTPKNAMSGESILVFDPETRTNAVIDLPKIGNLGDFVSNYFGFNKHAKNKEQSAAELTALARKHEPVKNLMSIKNWYEDKGYRPEAIGAILGNIAHETGKSFDWQQKEVTSKDKKGHGIFQLDHKMTQYKQFLKQEGAKDSLEMQMLFMHETIYGGWQHVPGYGNAEKLREVFETGTLEEITKAFEDLWEKPKSGSSDKRIEEAQALHSNLYVDD